MRRASYFILATLIAFMSGGWTPSVVSASGVKRCDRKHVSKADVNKLRPVAVQTAAGHQLDWSTIRGCTNSNGAWADISIVNEPQPDGSLVHGATWCYRDRGSDWKCDYAKGRAYQMKVRIGGEERVLYTDIPDGMLVEIASRVMQQAIDVAPGLSIAQGCSVDERNIQDWQKEALEEIHRDFQLPGDQPYARMSDAFGHLYVEIGLNQLYFEPAAEAATFRFSCWDVAFGA